MDVEDRLRSLLSANRSIVAELSLPAVLRRIVEAARTIVGAHYAALGVIGPDGMLEQFVHSGMEPELVARIGDLPRGRGVLGALIAHPEPIRLHTIGDDPRSAGFPPGHPPMRTFLGVPIRSREEVFGNLYITDRLDGEDFSERDAEMVLALAATAGIAIENARLYEESRRRQEWLRASDEISHDLLAPHEDDRAVLRRVAGSVRRLADADVVLILLPVAAPADELEVVAVSGAADAISRRYPRSVSVAGQAMADAHGRRLTGVAEADGSAVHVDEFGVDGPVMVVPLTGQSAPQGAIVLGRPVARGPFTAADLEMAEAFAGQAAVALELAAARADQQRLTALEDRDRIARDLHDHVIQRLFATGLSIQSVAALNTGEPLRSRLMEAVDDLDETIRQIRTSIFALRTLPDRSLSVRSAALQVIEQLKPVLQSAPEVTFTGPLDSVVTGAVVDDVVAVLREALTNVAKHARARKVHVRIGVDGGELDVTVIDDGVGMGSPGRQSGLRNLLARAERHGGMFRVGNRPEGGLELTWRIPVNP